jgi:hypothetical protein
MVLKAQIEVAEGQFLAPVARNRGYDTMHKREIGLYAVYRQPGLCYLHSLQAVFIRPIREAKIIPYVSAQ